MQKIEWDSLWVNSSQSFFFLTTLHVFRRIVATKKGAAFKSLGEKVVKSKVAAKK